ncbi:MAG: response regulator [Granulosicoccus sp.]|nr:response regulator [Granulosicoccus sp.]
MTTRLLLVEPSATMRYVLEKHAQSLGFTVDVTESYTSAAESLDKQYQQFGREYGGLLFGWPTTPQAEATALASLLEQSAYKDLPVVVMSTDMRAETRAWVAGRDNTAVLAWKEYQGLDALLQRLIEVVTDDGDTFNAKFDNSDIHLLVVDDSATIRYSLRDLFQMQGYRVSLAATQEEALKQATSSVVDIAVLDFYLTETTGDLLCRELLTDPAVGDIVCTVLTGTYSDHIIKRSLRAGAVECMFKNESSELLLSRIDAISRFVRQRRDLQGERVLLEEIIETVAGAVLVVEPDHRISYINDAGLLELQLSSRDSLVGQQSETLLEIEGPGAAGRTQHSAIWRRPDGEPVSIDYEHTRIEQSGRSLIRFARSRIAVSTSSAAATDAIDRHAASAQRVIEQLSLLPAAERFIEQMQHYLADTDSRQERTSLLILDVSARDADGRSHPVDETSALLAVVIPVLEGIYRRPGHVARLTGNRFGFLLRHRQEAQVYLLVRKIMQLCIELKHDIEGMTITCTGSLLSLVENREHAKETLLQHAFKGVDLVNSRGPDQVLLMDLRRMLSAYPATENQPLQ